MKRLLATLFLFAMICPLFDCVDPFGRSDPPDDVDDPPVPELAAEILLPVDGKVLGEQELSDLEVFVEFRPASGATINSADISADLVSVTDGSAAIPAATVSRFGASHVFAFSDFTGLSASAGTSLTVTVAAGWTDSDGNEGPNAIPSTLDVEAPEATIILPASGQVIGPAALGMLVVRVEFAAAGNNSIDSSAIAAGVVEATRGGTSISATAVSRVSGTNTFEFSAFPGLSSTPGGPLTIEVAAGWTDSAGNAAPDTASRIVPVMPPAADLVNPFDGQTIDVSVLNSRKYIDVSYRSVTGTGIDPATISDTAAEFTLSGPGTGAGAVQVSNSTVLRLYGSTYRYFLTGAFVAGSVDVDFAAGTFAEIGGNPNLSETESFDVSGPSGGTVVSDLSDPLDGTLIGVEELTARLFFDVNFYPADGNSIDEDTIQVGGVAADGLIDVSGAGLSHDGSATRLEPVEETNTHRFGLIGTAEPGELAVTVAGVWTDNEGNPGAETHATITVDLPSASILVPPEGKAIGEQEATAARVLVEFQGAADNGVDPADISASLVSVDDGTAVSSATAVARIGDGNVYEFSGFTGMAAAAGTALTIHVAAGWIDSAGNVGPPPGPRSVTIETPQAHILFPPDGAAIPELDLGDAVVMVEFVPVGNNSVAPSDIAATIVRVHNGGDTVEATVVTRISGTNTYQFSTFTGLIAAAGDSLIVEVISGWPDSAGNLASQSAAAGVEVY